MDARTKLIKEININVGGNDTLKRDLINLIAVDLQNVKCEIFKDKYSKKAYGNDLFLYFDSDDDMIGASIGAIYQKEYERYGCYDYKYDNFRKNRSGLEEHAVVIIRIPASERYYKQRYNKKYNQMRKIYYHKELKERLVVFKNRKYEKYSDADIIAIQKRILNYLMENLRNDEAFKSFKSVNCFASNIPSLLKSFASDIQDYETHLKMVNEEKEMFKNNNVEWVKSKSWNYKQLLKNIGKIINWNNCLPEEA